MTDAEAGVGVPRTTVARRPDRPRLVVPPTAAPRRVSVITVTYRSEGQVRAALDSALAAATHAGFSLEIVVVDNASPDRSVALVRSAYPEAIVIENRTNLGFGTACNQAFDHASGDLWLLLNPDAALDPGALGRLVAFLDDHREAAAVGARIVAGSQTRSENAGMAPGLRSLAGHFLLLNMVLPWGGWRGFFVTRGPAAAPIKVDWCGAAVLLVRPKAIRAVGGFDPTFFLYGEDVDLGIRLTAEGWEVWLDPSATARHEMGGSQPGISTRWVDGTLDVVRRRNGPVRARVAAGIMAVGLAARAVLAAVRYDTPEARHHSTVMRASAGRALAHVLANVPPRRDQRNRRDQRARRQG